jgi:hypothetical protein
MVRPKLPTHTAASLFSERAEARDDLAAESDRAVVLIATAYLDEALAGLLRRLFIDKPTVVAELLGPGDRPISTFSARIKLVYCLGHLGEGTFSDLELIRNIRNDFAHSRQSIGFGTASVRDRCLGLRIPMLTWGKVTPDFSDPRTRFIESTFWLGNVLQAEERSASHPEFPTDRP